MTDVLLWRFFKRCLSVQDAYFCVKYEPLLTEGASSSQYVRVPHIGGTIKYTNDKMNA